MPYTDITILLDRSGSMMKIKDAMESGFEEFLNGHKENPSTHLTLIQFDDQNDQDVVYTAKPVAEVQPLKLEPRGMTPLLDALCWAIDDTGRRLSRMKESERPNKVLFIVITDGLENASRTFDRAAVRQRIDHQTSKYSWEFVYLGANQDAIATAKDLNFDWKKAITYTADDRRTKSVWRGLTANTVNYANYNGPIGSASASLDWTDLQKGEAVEDPKKSKTT